MAHVLVTGTERGLGLAFCRVLSARGDRVFATCQERSPELDALDVEVIDGIDVGRDDSVARLAAEIDTPALDLIISNAGFNAYSGGFADADPQRMLREYNVNTLGTVRVIRTLLSKLGRGAKVAITSTGSGAAVPCGAPAHGEHYGYRMSKGALNVYGSTLAEDLHADGIAVVLLSPGSMDTKHLRDALAASRFDAGYAAQAKTADEVAPELLAQIDRLTLDTSGLWLDGTGQQVLGPVRPA
jgi:NAD(P)-dependent dehydrogenase (short-subunit alcohol dehydrogenase family)